MLISVDALLSVHLFTRDWPSIINIINSTTLTGITVIRSRIQRNITMSSRPAAPTIPSVKQSFITSQTTLLSQPVAPSRSWQETNDASDEAIPDRVVQEVLYNLNHTIQQHCRRVYPPQASRSIAEQINDVYTKDAERKVGGPADTEGGIGRELDLSEYFNIRNENFRLILFSRRRSYRSVACFVALGKRHQRPSHGN
jgi:hypothetical protein